MGKSSFFKSVIKNVDNVTGLRLGESFTKKTINSARLGQQTCLYSRAENAKGIIKIARDNLDEFNDSGLRKRIESAFDGNASRKDLIGLADEISAGGHTIQDETFTEAIKQYAEKADDFEKVFSMNKKGKLKANKDVTASDVNQFLGKEGDELGFWTKYSGFVHDEKYGTSRVVGAAAAMYGGGALTVRHLSGGNLTTNSRGEKDIAGIPLF